MELQVNEVLRTLIMITAKATKLQNLLKIIHWYHIGPSALEV